MSSLVHVQHDGRRRWAVRREDRLFALHVGLRELLSMPLQQAREVYESAREPLEGATVPLPPVDEQEVWAAGVTYVRSREGRIEESAYGALYDHIYDAERPELFFKSTAARVVTDGEPVGIRADSGWDVPEAEVGLVVTAAGELFGYLPGNDMSSRAIEGDNPLYLPQAKVYTRSCALGAGIVPAWLAGDGPFDVSVRIERDGTEVYAAGTSTGAMRRAFPDLVDWLLRSLDFPAGVVLLTGTGLVPEREFTLQAGDVVVVDVAGVGTLTNPVTVVGR